MIDSLLERLKDTKISYSVGTYAIALMLHKGLITEDEVVNFIEETEKNIKDEYKTEQKTDEQLEEIKKLFDKEVSKIECVFVDSVKDYVLGVVFKDNTYTTIRAYEDIEKIKSQIEKVGGK